jgi:D-serine deaminase-like pyridoxal phosphate-dependent protein
MKETISWYQIKNIDQIDTPALVIYRSRAKENIRLLKSMIDNQERLRPHVKTNKTMEGTLLMMEEGISKFKCATIAEAEMLAICKAADVLLAYPVLGPKLQRFIKLVKTYPSTKFSCLIDSKVAVEQISAEAIKNNLSIDAYIDLNVGMNRTGIKPGKEAIQLYIDTNKYEGITVHGFHAYDGHIREIDIQKRTITTEKSFAPVEAMSQKLKKMGFGNPKIIIGGSPTFPIYAKNENVECCPGTFIFWDKGYQDSLPEQQFLPAALIITRVISLPDETKICLDMGYKSIASENDLNQRIHFLNAPDIEIASQSEEHLVLKVPVGHSWKIGDVFYGVPIHICPTCALYEKANIVEDGVANDTWEIIGRNRKISI